MKPACSVCRAVSFAYPQAVSAGRRGKAMNPGARVNFVAAGTLAPALLGSASGFAADAGCDAGFWAGSRADGSISTDQAADGSGRSSPCIACRMAWGGPDRAISTGSAEQAADQGYGPSLRPAGHRREGASRCPVRPQARPAALPTSGDCLARPPPVRARRQHRPGSIRLWSRARSTHRGRAARCIHPDPARSPCVSTAGRIR